MKLLFRLGVSGLLLAAIPPALADPAPVSPAAIPAEENPFGVVPSVAGAQLAKMTGQANIAQEVQATNTSTVANNMVEGNSVTGNISFGSGAFQNLNGLSVLSANSGNNVAIDASLNVNVAVRP